MVSWSCRKNFLANTRNTGTTSGIHRTRFHAATKSMRHKSRRTGVTVARLENHKCPLRISSSRILGKTKTIIVVVASPEKYRSNLYGALLDDGSCLLIRKPLGMGSKRFSFSWMLRRLRQYHDWCTKGPCAGSINPMIPWSTCDGSSQDSRVILYFSLNTGSCGASGTFSGVRDPGEVIYTQTYPSCSAHG